MNGHDDGTVRAEPTRTASKGGVNTTESDRRQPPQ